MQHWLRCNNSSELIVVMCGWGMDNKPFEPLNSNSDVLFLYNFDEICPVFDSNFYKKYKKITLIAFSYGVFMASIWKDFLPEFNLKIAVNGTLRPIDDEFGIPHKVFKLTLENLSLETLPKFRTKLFNDKAGYELFNKHLSNRSLDDSAEELASLKKHTLTNKDATFDYDFVIISSDDKIIPTKNQINYWNCQKVPVNKVFHDSGHFCFYKFKTFEDIITLCEKPNYQLQSEF